MAGKILRENGNASIEYAIAIATIALASVGGLILLGMTVGGGYDYIANSIEMQTPVPTAVITATNTITQPTQVTAPAADPVERDRESTTDDETGDERSRQASAWLFDNFDDGDTEDWYPVRGETWRNENGRYCAGKVKKEHRTLTGDPTWTDYIVSTQAELSEGKGFGIYFRATNPDKLNSYVFQYDPGYGIGAFLYRKVVNGREKRPFKVVRVSRGYEWYNTVHHVEVWVEGNTFTAFIDGQQVLQASEPEYKAGQVGLRTWGGSTVCFDDLSVMPLD